METTEVAVIGAGVMGAATAWQLAARGVRPLLLEQFGPGHQKGASHGSARIFRFAYPDLRYARMAAKALPLWRELEDFTGTSVLTMTGGVDVGSRDVLAPIATVLEQIAHPGRWMSAAESTERWPMFRVAGAVLYSAHSGRLDADAAVAAMVGAAQELGADVRFDAPVRQLRPTGHGVEIVLDEMTVAARTVVVCAGAWTAKLLGSLVRLRPMRVTQEQPAHFRDISGIVEWPAFIHHRGVGMPIAYGLRAPGDGIKIGFHIAGVDCDADARDFAAEPGRLRQLCDYVRDAVPGVDADSAEPVSCTYTLTPDEHFVVDRSGPIVIGAGFSGHGFKFAPVIGATLADLADGGVQADPCFRAG